MSGYGYRVASNYWKNITVKNFSAIKGVSHKCVFCGSTERLSIDHKIPKSKGKTRRSGAYLANYQLLCEPCNFKKGNNLFTGDAIDRVA